jgi:hypothetical protein
VLTDRGKQTMADIRSATRLIIKRDGKFLVGASGLFLRWSESPYDAWHTRNRTAAFNVAWKVRGLPYLFNPVAGQIREYRGGQQ